MKKILNTIKNKELDVLFLIIIIVSQTFLTLLDYNDELWNFANCYKMFNGYKIYEELNVIITPLFFYIAQIFFKILGATILSFRIYNVCIFTVFFMLVYLIFKSLKIVKRRAVLYTIIMFYILNSMITCGANYNIFALIPILIDILLIIRKKDKLILHGILLFLTFMLKQNVFIYFAIGILSYKLINTSNIKKTILELFKIYLTCLVCIAIFLIYMYFDDNLYNFINYCFLGIGEFGSSNFYIEIFGARYLYLSILAIIFTFFMMYNKKMSKYINKEIISNIKLLLSFGIPLLLISFPIINKYHTTLGSTIIFIEIIYIIENILIKDFNLNRKKEKRIYTTIILVYIIYILYIFILHVNWIDTKETLLIKNGPFYGSTMVTSEYDDMEKMCNYIKEQAKNNVDVKVLSYKANLYMTNLNKNNGIFDLPFKGNLGIKGEEGLIEKIKQLENTLILIEENEDNIFWQESKIVRDYIINNYQKIGDIIGYNIFYKK